MSGKSKAFVMGRYSGEFTEEMEEDGKRPWNQKAAELAKLSNEHGSTALQALQ